MKRAKQNIREERERGGEQRIKGKTERRSEGERERGRREGWGERKQKTWEGERGERGVGERKERPESGVHERLISVSSGKSLPHMSVLIHKPMVRHQQQQMILRRSRHYITITSLRHTSNSMWSNRNFWNSKDTMGPLLFTSITKCMFCGSFAIIGR